MALLDVDSLSVTLPVAQGDLLAVRDVSFSIERAETLCLVGESGCGKSLTAAALLGLLPRNARMRSQRMQFEGANLADSDVIRGLRGRRIAAVFQDPMTSLNPSYTVGEQLTEGMRHHLRLSSSAARNKALGLLERVGIPSPAQRYRQYPHQLSGGLRQRVTIAMALACDPTLIIADEPTTALDVTVQAQVLRLLGELQSQSGMALLLITHDLSVVAQMSHRTAVMYAGELVESGATSDVMRAPRHPYTRALIDCLPRHGVEQLGIIPGLVPTVLQSPTGCVFADRCRHARIDCTTAPAPVRGDGTHLWRCIL